MYGLMGIALLLDLVVVITWTSVSPLEYRRELIGSDWNESSGLISIESAGRCRNSGNVSTWAFVGPLIVLHLALMAITNVLLWKNRNVEDRYQESKYVNMASIYVFEILVIGLPVLLAVDDSNTAEYIVLCAIVFLNDVGILCFIFIPKMFFVREGLPEGVTVGESVSRDTMQKAMQREESSRMISREFRLGRKSRKLSAIDGVDLDERDSADA